MDPVKEKFKSSWYAGHSEEERYMVQQAASLVSNILGGDYSVGVVPASASRSRNTEYSFARAAGGSFSFIKNKTNSAAAVNTSFFCKRHGNNKSHGTENCISLNKGKSTDRTRNEFHGKSNFAHTANGPLCRYGCGAKWDHNHRCDKYYQSDDYKRKRAAEDRVVLAITRGESSAVDDMDLDYEPPASPGLPGGEEGLMMTPPTVSIKRVLIMHYLVHLSLTRYLLGPHCT